MTTTLLPTTATSIRRVLREYGRLGVDPDDLPPEADLFQCGMTRLGSVNVMLALEYEFEVEFPKRLIQRDVFRSIGSIERALQELIAD